MTPADSLFRFLEGRRGHFRMESGYHSAQWFNLDRLVGDADRIAPFVAELAARLARHQPEAICGPEAGGARLAELIAARLDVPAIAVQRIEPAGSSGLFAVRYSVPARRRPELVGKRVAVVDDAVSAGSAIRGTVTDLVHCGAEPAVIGALIVFGDKAEAYAADRRIALEAFASTSFEMWLPEECPLCRRAVPLEAVSDASESSKL